jgi:hypothetical protein
MNTHTPTYRGKGVFRKLDVNQDGKLRYADEPTKNFERKKCPTIETSTNGLKFPQA